MKKELYKLGILVGIFLFAVMIFAIIFNTSGKDLTSEIEEASLPVVYLSSQGIDINPLFGYTEEMDPLYTRDTITPLYENDMSLPITIRTYGEEVEKISYEVRTLDASRLIESTTVTEYVQEGETIKATLNIQNLLEPRAEYLLILSLDTEHHDVKYYTRLMIASDCYAQECIAFALDFHDGTFDESRRSELSVYMESNSSVKNDDLSYVTIKSSLKQVCWDGFEGTEVGKLQISVKEIKQEYSVIVMRYVVTSVSETGETEYYNVEEYFRVRRGEKRMYLIEYERTMNQIFREDGTLYYKGDICLGIRDSNVNYANNEKGDVICFVQEGELWSYNIQTDTLIKIFSFRSYEGVDERENNPQHEIRVVRVDESGGTDFIVYGYMNRGIHEGKVGISVYHYDSELNTIEELLWISSDKSYQMMEEVVGQLMYVNSRDQFYVMLEGVIWKVDLKTKEMISVARGEGRNWFRVSDDNSIVAWVGGQDDSSSAEIHVLDMETETKQIIAAKEGYYVRPLGFMQNDLIYGEAAASSVEHGISGAEIFPISTIYIMNEEYEVIKEYHKEGIFTFDISIEDYCIKLERKILEEGSYVATTSDSIMNMAGDEMSVISIDSYQAQRRQKVVLIKHSMEIEKEKLNFLTAKLTRYEDDRTAEMQNSENENYYYAYAKGKVIKISESVPEVVIAAANQAGVVIDGNGQYIWEQAKSDYKNTFSGMKVDVNEVGTDPVERCIRVIFAREQIEVSIRDQLDSGRTVKQILSNSIPNATVLDLTGCELRHMLYYVNNDTPVYAMVSGTKPVLIVGYSSTHITIYDPEMNETKTISQEEGEQLFARGGNVFIAYIMKEEQ